MHPNKVMNEEFDRVYKELDREVTDMHFRWQIYREIYAKSSGQIDLLNRHGSNFFYYTQFLMLDHIALAFSKLTDPNSQGRNDIYKNMSLKQFHVFYSDAGEIQFVQKLKKKFGELINSCEIFRELRNKRIAHADYDHALDLSANPLPGISRAYTENALSHLREYMNLINVKQKNTTTFYEQVIEDPNGSVSRLIDALELAEKNI